MQAAFAPSHRVLDPSYIAHPADLRVFLRLRGRRKVDVQAIASWYGQPALEHRQAALRYLVRGKPGNEVLPRLNPPHARPDWLTSYDDMRVDEAALRGVIAPVIVGL